MSQNRQNQKHPSKGKVMGISLGIGLLYWVFDSIVDYFYAEEQFLFSLQHGPISYIDSFIANISKYVLIERLSFLSASMIAGILVYYYLQRQQKSENEMRTSEIRFQTLIETLPIIIFYKDIQGKYQVFNKEFPTRLGIVNSDILEKKDDEIFGELGKHFMEIDKKIIQTKKGTEEINEFNLNGEKRYYKAIKTPLLDTNEEVIGILGISEDVTDDIKAQEQEIRNQKLESLGILAGGLAHDFNNILMGILGNVEILEMEMEEDKALLKYQDNFTELKSATFQARDIAYQIMTFAKGHQPQKKPVNYYKLVQDSCDFIFHGKNITYEISFDNEIPLMYIDPNQIQQALNNILINAIQSMDHCGKVLIKVKQIEKNNQLYLDTAIEDSGLGIKSEIQAKIFDPYFTTKPEGTGLGLTMSYRIIKNHEGEITFNSELNKGTTFHIILPIHLTIYQEEVVQHQQFGKFKGKILVLEDQLILQKTLKAILIKLGFEVVICEDGTQVLENYRNALQNDPFAAVILDLTIPGGMGGKETMERLVTIDPDVKAYVSSGYSEDPILANYLDYGFFGVLNKPYSLETLKSELERLFIKNIY